MSIKDNELAPKELNIKKGMNKINARYIPPEQRYWEGRPTNPEVGIQYWHQLIQLQNLEEFKSNSHDNSIGIVGYVCDEGVRRNRGRIGARKGPEFLRERLAKLPVHFDSGKVMDMGDIVSVDRNMEACQEMLAEVVSNLLDSKVFPIVVGGGHDLAYGHFNGIARHLKNSGPTKIGIINFDAHFDMRPVEGRSNSGTPFNQILNEYKDSGLEVEYFAIGIQQQSNTRELYQVAKDMKAQYAINYDCESSGSELNALKDRLRPVVERNHYLYISIDMDGFSSAYTPGVSAPSPLGFTPYFMMKMLSFCLKQKK